jgi:hypothetical protein
MPHLLCITLLHLRLSLALHGLIIVVCVADLGLRSETIGSWSSEGQMYRRKMCGRSVSIQTCRWAANAELSVLNKPLTGWPTTSTLENVDVQDFQTRPRARLDGHKTIEVRRSSPIRVLDSVSHSVRL